MSTTGSIDLSKLPPPNIVEELSFEQIFKEMQQSVAGVYPMLFKDNNREPFLADAERLTDENGEVYFRVPAVVEKLLYVNLESDPSSKLLAVWAYRECLIRQRMNDAVRAVMLAYATDADLDQHAVNYNMDRKIIDSGDPEANPPIAPTYESDIEFRRRILLAFEQLSVAGPEGAYLFHASNASQKVLDAAVKSPDAGEVLVTIQSRDDDGIASAELIQTVQDYLSADEIRPMTDKVTVQSVSVQTYTVDAELFVYDGVDAQLVLEEARRIQVTNA